MLKLAEVAEQGRMPREEALRAIGEVYAAMVAGDGSIKPPSTIELVVGGHFDDAAALLLAIALYKAGKLAPERFKPYVYEGHNAYYVEVSGYNARVLAKLLATSAPTVGGEYLMEKFNKLADIIKRQVSVPAIERPSAVLKGLRKKALRS